MAFGLGHTANTMIFLTRFDEAWETAQDCLRVSQEIGSRLHVADMLAMPIPMCHWRNGDLRAARQAAEESARLAAPISYAFGEALSNYMLGLILRDSGEYQGALEASQRALEAARAAGYPMFIAMTLGEVGMALLDISAAFAVQIDEVHAEALQLLDTPVGLPGGGSAWIDLGYCVLAKGQVDLAHEFFHKGLTVPTTQMMLNRPRFLLGETEVALARQKFDEAQRWLAEARAFVEERAMTNLIPRITVLEARLSAARGEADRALTLFAQAEALAFEMGLRPVVSQARQGAAQILRDRDRAHEAEVKRRAAEAMLNEMAALFTDETLRALYLENVMNQLNLPG